MPIVTRLTDREYAAELLELNEQVLLMAARAEEMVQRALRALGDRDAAEARRINRSDSQVDDLEGEIDERCLRILARWHPMASDLRFITAVLKIVGHLERVADHAGAICRRTVAIVERPPLKHRSANFERLVVSAPALLRDALDAFANRDRVRARNVVELDSVVDDHHQRAQDDLMELLRIDSSSVEAVSQLQLIARSLERVADHATSVARLVLFMVEGKERAAERASGPGPSPAPLSTGPLGTVLAHTR